MHALYTLDIWWAAAAPILLLSFYYVTQGLYSLSFLVDGYLFSRPVNMVDMDEAVEARYGIEEGLSRRSCCSIPSWKSRNRSCARP